MYCSINRLIEITALIACSILLNRKKEWNLFHEQIILKKKKAYMIVRVLRRGYSNPPYSMQVKYYSYFVSKGTYVTFTSLSLIQVVLSLITNKISLSPLGETVLMILKKRA